MGWSFRRTHSIGPLRVNLSGSGVSASVGVRGARVLFSRRGTYVSLSGGGFTYRKRLSDPPTTTPQRRDSSRQRGEIWTADVETLESSSTDEFVAELNRRHRMTPWFSLYIVGACLGGFPLLSVPPALVAFLVAAFVAGVRVRRWDLDRRTTRIFYDVDDESVVRRAHLAANVGAALERPQRLWHVFSSVYTSDTKRNAGASHLSRRTLVACGPRPPPLIESNIDIWSIPAGPQRLTFLPDRLLIAQGGRFASVRYTDLEASAESTRFVETPPVPSDGECVGHTWRFVNRSGGPDRRFKNNYQLPIMRYGELTLRTRSGMNIVFQTSQVGATIGAAEAIAALGQDDLALQQARAAPENPREEHRAHQVALAPAQAALENATPPVPAHAQSTASNGSVDPKLIALTAGLLKYIALADRRYTDDEKAYLHGALWRLFPNSPEVIAQLIPRVDALRLNDEEAAAGSQLLATLDAQLHSTVMHECGEMALADGKMTPKERERFALVRRAGGMR